MNSRLFQVARPLAVLACGLFISACGGDDPELVRKRDEQRVEISKLESELGVLQERLKNLPPDQTKELAKLKADSDANVEEIAKLEAEVEGLEKEKAKLEKDFASYQRKYIVR
jgi:predicted  nucleic acid-binding Zn-ribbon protein